MDIRFSCPACGHHMIIDEAAAGMLVDCVECGREVKIPDKPAAPPPSPRPKSSAKPLPEKERTVALPWTPPTNGTHPEPKK